MNCLGKSRPHFARGARPRRRGNRRIILPGRRCQRRAQPARVRGRRRHHRSLGKDRGGQQLQELLSEQKIDTSIPVEELSTPSLKPVSWRVINRSFVWTAKVCRASGIPIEEVVAAVRKSIPETDAIIFEDYGKGFLSTGLVRRSQKLRARRARSLLRIRIPATWSSGAA